MVLFGVLIGFTSYWSVFDAEALKEKDVNKRPLFEQQQIPRGRILAADGTVIAKSVAKGKGAAKRYVRRYPEGSLFGHPIGYSFVQYGDSEFEQFHNDELIGEESEFTSIARRAARPHPGRQRHRHQPRRRRAEAGAVRARGSRLRRRRRDRAEHRRGQGDGLQRAFRPQPRALRILEAGKQRNRNAAAQPGDAGALPARLDLQGGDRGRRPRQRRDHAGNDDRRPGFAGSRRDAAGKRLRRGLLRRPASTPP